MAAPTLTYHIWEPITLQLTTKWSEAVTVGSAWAAGAIDITDVAGNRYENTATLVSGSGTDTVVVQFAASSSAAETVATLDFILNTFKNGGNEGNAAITDLALYTAIGHAAPFTNSDMQNLGTLLTELADGTKDATAEPYVTDIQNAAPLLLNKLLKCPRTEDRAYALITQMNKFNQSTKAPDDLQRLQAAVEELRASLNPSGTFQMLPNGT